jgi:hypothetical protein
MGLSNFEIISNVRVHAFRAERGQLGARTPGTRASEGEGRVYTVEKIRPSVDVVENDKTLFDHRSTKGHKAPGTESDGQQAPGTDVEAIGRWHRRPSDSP